MQTKQHNAELLKSQLTAGEQTEYKESYSNLLEEAEKRDEERKIIERTPIPRTPFTIIKTKDGWFTTMGKYRLTEIGTKEEAYEAIEEGNWMTIMKIVSAILQEMLITQVKENLQKEQEQFQVSEQNT